VAVYDRYRAAALAARLDWLARPVGGLLASSAALVPHSRQKTATRRLYRFLEALGQRPGRRYLSWINIFPPALLAAGYRGDFRSTIDFDEPLRWFDGLYKTAPGPLPNQAAHADFASYLPYDLLTKVDIASMACGLECRSPFLDHELVEFAVSLPLDWRLGPGGGKRILKDWARDRLPPEVLNRPKMGFGVPVGEWFRDELRDLLRDRILAPDALAARIFRPEWLRSFVEAHISGRCDHEHPLWALLMLELWHQRWAPSGNPRPS